MTGDWLGPLQHLDVRIEAGASPAAGLAQLRTLMDGGVIHVLDLEVVVAENGARRSLDAGAWGDSLGLDLHALDGTWSGLLDDDDLVAALADAGDGSVEIVVLYEITALAPVLEAFEAPGTHVTGTGSVSEDDLLAALDRGEAAEGGLPA
jgi:hypothetical protein